MRQGERSVARAMLGEIERVSRLAAAAMVGMRGYAAQQARSEALRADRDARWQAIAGAVKRKHARLDDDVVKQMRSRLDDLLLPTEGSRDGLLLTEPASIKGESD